MQMLRLVEKLASYMTGEAIELEDPNLLKRSSSRLVKRQFSSLSIISKLNKKIASEVMVSINQIEETGKIADTIASHLAVKIVEKQKLLEIEDVKERLEAIYGIMEGEIGVLQVEKADSQPR